MKRIFGFLFKADYVYCTLTVFGFMLGIGQLLDRFSFLNPIEMALTDFEMTDIVFSDTIRNEPSVDTNIVLVNFGDLPRRGIARQIEIIAAQKPKVLGIDCSFRVLKKPEEDSLLEEALSKVDNLVLYSKLDFVNENSENFDTIIYCHPRFRQYGTSGFCNLITPTKSQDEYKICRTFTPRDSVKGHEELAFALEIARLVDTNQVNRFLARKNPVELINYRGNRNMFYSLDVGDVLGYDQTNPFQSEPELPINLKDKIVLMGFMGSDFGHAADLTREDKFHTPMNPNYAGKAYPDMFGVVIHANIISMVLNDKPMNKMSETGGILLALILCYLNVIFFFYIHDYHPSWYDLVVKTVQVIEVIMVLFVAVMVYGNYQYQMDVTLAVIAVGLCGDILEVYTGAMYNIAGRFKNKIKWFIFKKKTVKLEPET
jgi:CHASE2 domain-containing sensor protein